MIKTLFTPKDGDKQPLPPVEAVGGKGQGLYWLMAHNFPVPPTWVLSTAAFEQAVKRAKLAEPIAKIERTIAAMPDDWAEMQRTMDDLEPQRTAVEKALEQVEMTDRIGAALTDLPLSVEQWAVRSSATVEDNPQYSFAGQFRSCLSVSRKGLWSAIRRVWASNYGREALLYCAQNRAPMPRMAVLLQPMEPLTAQDRSGVAISHSPVPTLPGVLIQASFGAGHVVVEGRGGDLFSVQGEKVQIQPLPPDQILVTAPEGDVMPVPSPPGLSLSEDEARELADLVLAVADKWGRPVNVEFVWRANKPPTLVQVRSVAISGQVAGHFPPA